MPNPTKTSVIFFINSGFLPFGKGHVSTVTIGMYSPHEKSNGAYL